VSVTTEWGHGVIQSDALRASGKIWHYQRLQRVRGIIETRIGLMSLGLM